MHIAEGERAMIASETADGNIESIPIPSKSGVSDELGRLLGILRGLCPRRAVILFEYDGALRVHIDIRRLEDVPVVETFLPSLCGGIFRDAQRGLSAKHSFFHRITATVAR